MKQYSNPMIEIVNLLAEDILTASQESLDNQDYARFVDLHFI